jgi:hypothetical protein
MAEQNLPGFCSAHWVLFTTAVCAASSTIGSGELDDQARAEKLYDTTMCGFNLSLGNLTLTFQKQLGFLEHFQKPEHRAGSMGAESRGQDLGRLGRRVARVRLGDHSLLDANPRVISPSRKAGCHMDHQSGPRP